MNKEQFEILIYKYIADVISKILINCDDDENILIFEFMKSKTYEMLIDEESKLWHLSSFALCEMYLNEKNKNVISYDNSNCNEKLTFKVFCLETFKNSYNLEVLDLIDIFAKYDVLKYIDLYFEELHSYGDKFIVEDLTLYLNARGYFFE